MGNTQPRGSVKTAYAGSRVAREEPWEDDYNWDAAHIAGLCARDAYRLALRGDPHRRLGTAILLITDPSLQVETSYDHIQFRFQGPQIDMASVYAARTLSLAWTVLAQCSGYGFNENPSFWKRVLAAREAWLLTGCARFFASERASGGGVFPRVELSFPDVQDSQVVATAWRVFRGFESVPDTEAEEQALHAVMKAVAPHVNAKRAVQAHVDVALYIQRPALDVYALGRVAPPSTTSTLPPIRLTTVRFKAPATLHRDDQLQETLDLLTQDVVTIPQLEGDLRWSLSRLPTRLFLQAAVLPTGDAFAGLCDLMVQRRNLSEQQFEMLCSSLPFTRTLRSIAFGDAGRYSDSTDHDLAWLGFALFHPDAVDSSWQHLQYQVQSSNEHDIRDLWRLLIRREYARQGEGEAAPRIRMAYSTATLATGTTLRVTTNLLSAALDVLEEPTRVDLLPNSQDPVEGWLRVVVPSLGLCWVEEASVVGEIEVRPAQREACISSLDVSHRNTRTTSREKLVVATFVKALGARLASLDIRFGGTFRSAQELEEMLVTCPRLTSLCVTHNGALWAAERESRLDLPQLEQLHLVIPYPPKFTGFASAAYTSGSLRRLRSIRISSREPSCLVHSARAIVEFVNSHRQLQYFHFLGTKTSGQHLGRDYPRLCFESKRRLTALGVKPWLFNHGASRQEAMLAILAVVCVYEKRGALAGTVATFGHDVMRRILSFNEAVEAKLLWLDA